MCRTTPPTGSPRHRPVLHSLFPALFLLIPLVAPPLSAQGVPDGSTLSAPEEGTGQVEGRVVAADSDAPLPGVTVELTGADLRVTTNSGGYFALRRVSGGPVTLVFRRLGYASVTREAVVEAGSVTRVDATLTPQPLGLDPILVLSQRTRMVGDPLNLGAIPGSAHFLSKQDLEARKLAFDNPHDVLRRVPGVNLQEEEGYGLRPNIGMRGTGVSRSSKVTLMEDGILIAPAPYAAPAAYYFPVMGRMEAVEVRKGSSQIRHGPRTVGGAINLISSSIPDRLSWNLDTQGAEDRTFKVRARAGDSRNRFGWMVETYQIRTDGFKELQSGGDTGFRLSDYTAKMRVNTDRNGPRYQELELKVGYNDQRSDETYLGLTEEDFRSNPLMRYPASSPDVINTEHTQIQLRHFFRPSRRLDLTTTLYHNGFARNWYKLHSVRGTGISSVLADPENYAQELAVLRGGDSEADALMVRANNREYFSRGIQSLLGLRVEGERLSHNLELGVRLHEDQEDRFQWEDGYRMTGGVPVLTSEGTPGTQANRVGDARALSVHLQNEMQAGRWTVVPGLRYESVDLTRTDYSTDDPRRDEPTRVRETTVSALIPGIGAVFALDPSLHLFGGVHRGFGPPGPGAAEETRAEESVNYELGTRVRRSGLAFQVAGFFSDYRNILGQATLATGETGRGDMFNGGAVHTVGVEASLDYDLAWTRELPVRLPVNLSYTYTRATFQTSFESDFDAWGPVEEGDHLPYLPQHQFSGSLGLEETGWGVTLSAFGSSAMRTRAGQGPLRRLDSTDAYVVLNLQADYELPQRTGGVLYAGIQNLTDRHYVVARRPAGARPGLPRTLFLGVRISR